MGVQRTSTELWQEAERVSAGLFGSDRELDRIEVGLGESASWASALPLHQEEGRASTELILGAETLLRAVTGVVPTLLELEMDLVRGRAGMDGLDPGRVSSLRRQSLELGAELITHLSRFYESHQEGQG